MCQLSYVLSPWSSHQRIMRCRACHAVSITWCAAQFPDVQGTDQAQTIFDRDSTHEYIMSHMQLAHQCWHYDNVEVERTRDWYYHGSVVPFAVQDLPAARLRWTTSASWV
ncbi:hypothetical protein QBC32DRAFT_245701 [Pseudoneurospora amorphoporcata]|uniref:Uncharacterized protein n=1 Tax=Pseudoneurospora amorphoporcata TaxID=241081 RepID=A0AAN6NRG6_9PEZI|nr:hypothetical protein QBC32DRAFT_245701 [Pseudoneurospora amorphoporcata]